MNFNEGMRRVGLALSVLGAVAILPHTYKLYEEFQADQEYLNRFVNLSQSSEVQKAVRMAIAQGALDQTIRVSADGISGVYIDKTGDILWINTPGGSVYKQQNFPSAVPLLIVTMIPVSCFVALWGIMKGVTWVISGFIGKHRV